MQNPVDIQGRLSIYRYAIMVVTVTAFFVSLYMPIVVTSSISATVNVTFDDVFIPSLFVTGAALFVGVVSYFAYAHILKTGYSKQH